MVYTVDEVYRDWDPGFPTKPWEPPKPDIRGLLNQYRLPLLADRTLYVNGGGSDSNSGDVGSPFRTKQQAVNVALTALDAKGKIIVIQDQGGGDTGNVIVDQPVLGKLIIRGDTSNWSSIVTNAGSGAACFDIRNGAVVSLEGFKTFSTGASHLEVSQGGIAYLKNWDFGAAGIGNHMIAYNEGNIYLTGDYKITGGAAVHCHATEKALIRALTPITVTLVGTPAFSNFFAGASNATAYLRSITYIGSVTGQRFYSHKNALIDTNNAGLNYFPGSIAGQAINGGIYDLMQLGRGINFAQPGYFIDDQGLWIQWGFSAFNNGNTVTFPSAFPTSCWGVMATPSLAPPATGMYVSAVSGVGNASFLAHGRQYSGGAVSTVSLSTSWFAWGN